MSLAVGFNIIIFLILMNYIYSLFKKNKELMFLLIPVLYVYVWCIASTIYLESGEIYISDLSMTSSFNFSAFKLMMYLFVFLTAIYFSFHYKKGKVSYKNNRNFGQLQLSESQSRNFLFLGLFIAMIWMADVAISGNVILTPGLTRFNYWDSYSKLSFVKYAVYFVNPMSFIMGIIFSKSLKRLSKILSVFTILFYFILSYLIGNQFSALISILLYFVIPVLFIKYDSFTKKQKTRTIVLVLILFAIVGYIKIKALTDYNEFVNRFLVLQGDLWFATDIHVTNHGANFGAFIENIEDIISGKSSEMDYLMRLVMPTTKYTIFKNGNVALYSGFPAYEIVSFGYIFSVIVVVLEGIVYGRFLKYIDKKIRHENMLLVLFAVYVLVQYNKAFTMCGYSYMFNLIPILCLLFVMFYETVRNAMFKR